MRILYLFAKRWYDTKMSMGRWLYGQALASHPDVDLKVWGVGWPAYDAKLTVAQNIKQNLPHYLEQNSHQRQWKPTHVWVYKGEDYIDLPELLLPKLIVFNEAYDAQATRREMGYVRPTHVVFHHENDYQRWRLDIPFASHMPHAAPQCEIIPPIVDRQIPCLVTGNLNKNFYPLRNRFSWLVRLQMIPGQIYAHPGYRLTDHTSVARQYSAYQQQLLNARLGLGCSSVMKYSLARFVELAMAGTVPVTDHPDDSAFARYFAKASIIVPTNSSYLTLRRTIKAELRDTTALQQRSDLLRKTAEAELSLSRYAQRMVNYLDE
jgi:hypothetical protein